jgi:hypothetical protein
MNDAEIKRMIVKVAADASAEAATLTASFAATSIVMLAKHLERSGHLAPGVMEKSIRDLLQDHPAAGDSGRLDLGFFKAMLTKFEQNKDWPGEKRFTLHWVSYVAKSIRAAQAIKADHRGFALDGSDWDGRHKGKAAEEPKACASVGWVTRLH